MICSYCGIYCGPGHILETHGKELIEERNHTALTSLPDLLDMLVDLEDFEDFELDIHTDALPLEDSNPFQYGDL